jgi:hypothetical protein
MSRLDNRTVTTTHLTPPFVLDALGGWASFDLDPCAAPEPRPWPTAQRMIALPDANGLLVRWSGRVFLNPPYSAGEIARWLERIAAHGQGVALINATTDTAAFHRFVWGGASGLLFLEGRLTFCDANGRPLKRAGGRSDNHNPAPSVLCAYGQDDLDRLAACDLDGALIPLRFARFALVAGLDQTWTAAIGDWLRRQHGPVSLSDAYRYFARHPKARSNPNWQAKVRQKLQQLGTRVERATYAPKQPALI